MDRISTARNVQRATSELLDITFTQAFLILALINIGLVFIIDNAIFNAIDTILTFIGIEYARQILLIVSSIIVGFFLSFITRDNDLTTAGIIAPLIYIVIDLLWLQNSTLTQFSLLS